MQLILCPARLIQHTRCSCPNLWAYMRDFYIHCPKFCKKVLPNLSLRMGSYFPVNLSFANFFFIFCNQCHMFTITMQKYDIYMTLSHGVTFKLYQFMTTRPGFIFSVLYSRKNWIFGLSWVHSAHVMFSDNWPEM